MVTPISPPELRTIETPISEVLDRYTRPALALARRIVIDERLAEDVVQEAFVAYWQHPDAFKADRGTLGAWLLSVVHHKAVDAVRREASHRRQHDALVERDGHDAPVDVAETALTGLDGRPVRAALQSLPAAQREALVLAYWGGFTQRQIAARTGVPLGTVKTRMMVGMRALHKALSSAPAC